jgi:hypothetical protein
MKDIRALDDQIFSQVKEVVDELLETFRHAQLAAITTQHVMNRALSDLDDALRSDFDSAPAIWDMFPVTPRPPALSQDPSPPATPPAAEATLSREDARTPIAPLRQYLLSRPGHFEGFVGGLRRACAKECSNWTRAQHDLLQEAEWKIRRMTERREAARQTMLNKTHS